MFRECVDAVCDTYITQQFLSALLDGYFFRTGMRAAQNGADAPGTRAHMTSYHDIFDGRHVGEQTYVLKGARKTPRDDVMGFESGDGMGVEGDVAGIASVETGEHIEQGG